MAGHYPPAEGAESIASSPHSRRREKTILSCSFCRARKLRCNRESPCGACLRRGKAAECTYSSSEQARKDAIDYRPHAKRQQVRQRVARLETFVTEMQDRMRTPPAPAGDAALPERSSFVLSGESHAAGHATSSSYHEEGELDDLGKLSHTDDLAVYTGSSHWVTILEDIQRLKDELSEDNLNESEESEPGLHLDEDSPMTSTPDTRISLLNSGPSLPREQILSMLPLRSIVDKHVSEFFDSFDMAPFILHRGKFLTEYEEFWDSPQSMPIMWLGLLFSIMTISSFLVRHHQQEKSETSGHAALPEPPDATFHTYRALTIHCLVAGNYLRPSRYTIETLILHFVGDQSVNVDGTIANWVLMGVIIRLALRMGLHRDPSRWPSIRPLQAEMRRRIWIALYQMDFFTSVQVGLSRIVKDAQCDTRPPMHLDGQELDQDVTFAERASASTAPSQPQPGKITPLSFTILRYRIIKVAAAIYDATEEVSPPPPTILAALASRLDKAVEAVPAQFKYASFESSIADGPIITLHRIVLDVLIQKAVYLLHRRSFTFKITGDRKDGSNKNAIAESQERCIQAALTILEHQQRMSREMLPGGFMFDIRWKVAASINHEALQATMMLCFALSAPTSTLSGPVIKRRSEMLEALDLAKQVFEKRANQSADVHKASNAISAVLQQQQQQQPQQPGIGSGNQGFSLSSGSDNNALPFIESQYNMFVPMLGVSGQGYSDFNEFGYGGNIDFDSLDPTLFTTSIEDS